VILDTSNIAKYSVGQRVCGMGQSGSLSGTITAVTGESPSATSGRGQLTIQPYPIAAAAAAAAPTFIPVVVAAAGAVAVLACELPLLGSIARVALKLKRVYDATQHADAGCAAMAKWAADVESVVTQLPPKALGGAASGILPQLLLLLERMLAAADARAAQATVVQYASSAACKAQQRAAQAELARLLSLLQLGAAGAALTSQVEMMGAVLRSEAKIDEILDQSRRRSQGEERQHARDRTANTFSIPRDAVKLHMGETLGVGGSATVYKATYQRESVAAKVMSTRGLGSKELGKIADKAHRELAVMAKLSSPYIIRVLGICEDPEANQIIMIMQLAEGGSVRNLLDSCTAPLTTADAVKMLLDTATGMEYLHSKEMVHRDVKSMNLLIDDKGRAVVSDFGISKSVSAATAATATSIQTKGSAPWMSPQALEGEPATKARDVFGFGVVMWEVMSLQKPWEDKELVQIMRAVCFNPSPENRPPLAAISASYPMPLLALMQECWAQDPAARPSFADIARQLGVLEAAHPSTASTEEKKKKKKKGLWQKRRANTLADAAYMDKGVVGAGYIALGETALPSQHRPQPNPIASSSSAQAVILDTSNIAKYSVGQRVCGMGQSGSLSGTITAITGESPFATSGRGQLTIQP
jgi:serine/threonine protein kinase